MSENAASRPAPVLPWAIRAYAATILIMCMALVIQALNRSSFLGTADTTFDALITGTSVISLTASAVVGVIGAAGMLFLRSWGRRVLIVAHILASVYILVLLMQTGPFIILMVVVGLSTLTDSFWAGMLMLTEMGTWFAAFAMLYPGYVADELS